MKLFESLKQDIHTRAPWLVTVLLASIIAFSFTTQDSIMAIGLLSLVTYLLKPSFQQYSLKQFALTKYMLFAILWLVIVLAMSQVAFVALNGFIILSTIPLMYLIATEYSGFNKVWQFLKWFLMLIGALFAVWALFQVGHQIGKGLAEGPYNDRNTFASLMNALWFLTAWQFFTNTNLQVVKANNQTLKQTFIITSFFLISLALFVTTSRGAMIAWWLLSPLMLWASYLHTKSKQKLIIAIALLATAYFLGGVVFQSSLADRTFELTKDSSAMARLQIWISTFYMAIDHPIVGLGWDNFQFFYPQYRYVQENSTAGLYAHNDYLQLAAEGGLMALLLIGGLLIFTLKRVVQLFMGFIKNANSLSFQFKNKLLIKDDAFQAFALTLGVAAVMIHAGVNFIFYYSGVNILIGLYLGRIAFLTEKNSHISLPKFVSIRPSIKTMICSVMGILIMSPFLIHALLQFTFTGSQPVLKILKATGSDLNSFDLASITVNVYPHNYYAQEYIMRTYESLLLNVPKNANVKQTKLLLNAAIEDFDKFRSYNANWATYGAREVKLIMANINLDNNQNALRNKANKIVLENLESNVFHSESYLLKARLELMEGNKIAAEHTIDDASKHMLSMYDLILVNLQYQLQHKKISASLINEMKSVEADMLKIRDLSEKGHMDKDFESRFKTGEALLKRVYYQPDL
jgi:O-antigen ligase